MIDDCIHWGVGSAVHNRPPYQRYKQGQGLLFSHGRLELGPRLLEAVPSCCSLLCASGVGHSPFDLQALPSLGYGSPPCGPRLLMPHPFPASQRRKGPRGLSFLIGTGSRFYSCYFCSCPIGQNLATCPCLAARESEKRGLLRGHVPCSKSRVLLV